LIRFLDKISKVKIKYYPNKKKVSLAAKNDDPLVVLISCDASKLLMSGIDDSFEHVILLRKLNISDSEIDKYFRLIVNKSGADWTFVCPTDYKNIKNREKRIEQFYKDGVDIIKTGLKKIGYDVPIDIPKRFRRHFEEIGSGGSK